METERTVRLDEDSPSPPFSELTAEELETVKRYVELTRHLQELHQLFLIFKFDLDAFLSRYRITSSGEVFCGDILADSNDDYIAVNAGVISIISAGKTLVESMRTYVRENCGKESKIYLSFEAFCSSVYDHTFAYRFLMRLRDYAQHGHLPVNKDKGWYGFDLKTIVEKPRFKQNGKIQKELETLICEVQEKYGDLIRMPLADMLAQYTPKLLSIYRIFWSTIEKEFLKNEADFWEIVRTHPENVFAQEDCHPGFFSYNLVNGNLDVVSLEKAFDHLIQPCKKEGEKVCNEYETAWKDYIRGRTAFRLIDEDYLEVLPLEELLGN